MSLVHFLYTPFTGLGLYNGFRGDTWLKQRIQIFKNYTLQSILSQSNRDFTLWISWRPEEEHNPIVQEFFKHLTSLPNLKVIFTFHGILFWDDKYSDEEASKRLMESLKKTLPELKEAVGDAKWVLMTLQPSDDMYLPFAVQKIQDWSVDGKGACGWKKGYIMNYATKEIAEYTTLPPTTDTVSQYRTNTIPPFFTIRFHRDIFLDPEQHYRFTGPYKSHEYVADHMPYHQFGDERGFIVGTHGANISTIWHHRYQGRMLEAQEREDLLWQTGTYLSDPIVINWKRKRMVRKIIHKLPFTKQIFWALYYITPSKWRLF